MPSFHEQPKFVSNFVTVAARAISLQKRAIASQLLRKNLVENTRRIAASKVQWCQFVIANTKEVYTDVRQRITEMIMAIESDLQTFEIECDYAANPDKFYENVVKGVRQLCHTCCDAHDIARSGYVRMVETDVQLALRSMDVCSDSVSSRAKLVESFELGTLIWARLAESCSTMSIQSTTPPTLSGVLQEYFNSINDLNEAVAAKINAFILSTNDKQRELAKDNLMKTIQQMKTIVNELDSIVKQELASIEREDYFKEFLEEIEDIAKHNKLRKDILDSEIDHIQARGAESRLNKHIEQTGTQASPALRKLAEDTDQISVLLQQIYFALSNGDGNVDIEGLIERAAPAILDLPKSSKLVLVEEAGRQKDISSRLSQEIMKQKEEIKALPKNKEGKNSIRKIIQSSINMVSKEKNQPLFGDAKAEELRVKLASKYGEAEPEEVSTPDRRRIDDDLVSLVGESERDLTGFADEVLQKAEENRKILLEIDEQMYSSAHGAHTHLIEAAKEITMNGLGADREAKLLKACEKVENLVEISNTLIPYAEEENPWEEPEPIITPSKPSDILTALLSLQEQERIQDDVAAESQLTADDLEKIERRRRREEERKRKLRGVIFNEVQKIEKRLEDLEVTPEIVHVKTQKLGVETTGNDLSLTDSVLSNVSGPNDTWGKSEELQIENIWRERGSLQFEKIDGKWLVKAGSFNQLVIHLTSPLDNADDALAGSDFFRTFMMTLQTFTEPETFVAKLIERYNVPPCPEGIPSSKNYELDLKHPVQMRVCNVLKKWIVTRYDQDLAHKPKLIEDCFRFINDDVVKDSEYLSRNLRQCLTLYISGERFLYHKQVAEGKGKYDINGLYEDAPILDTLTRFDPREVARQITLIDSELFRAIRLYELAGQAWNKKDAATRAPNLTKLIQHTNRLSNWVAATIIRETKIAKRRKVMCNMILLCQYLFALRNFHSVMGVLAGLSSSPVSRLKYTKRELSAKFTKILTELETEMSSASSFSTYRQNLKKEKSACVPFLGVILSDLTFMEDGNHDFTETGLINWQKRTLLYSVLSQFLDFQSRCFYSFPEPPLAKSLIGAVNSLQQSADELYKASLILEPRGGVPPELLEKPTFAATLKNLKEKATDAFRS